jgi:hypothetical protein
MRGGPTGVAGTRGGSGTGGASVDASAPDPWSYDGRPITRIDIQRCRPYVGCDVCTLTLANPVGTAVPNNDFTLPSALCAQPGADAGTGGLSLGPIFCGFTAPDGGPTMITEYVLQPNADTPDGNGFRSASCQFLPGPVIAEPNQCLVSFQDDFCVPTCGGCP